MLEKFSELSDQELYEALKGDKKQAESAFAELYSRYSQKIYAYCYRMTGNKDDTNDIYQETFLTFFHSAQKSVETPNVSRFLITIARRICLNFMRDKRILINLEDYNIQVNDTGYEQKEFLELVSSSLELLDIEFRETFILRQYHGLAYKEIAKITGVNSSTVRNRFWRAKDKLREILAPYLNEITNNK